MLRLIAICLLKLVHLPYFSITNVQIIIGMNQKVVQGSRLMHRRFKFIFKRFKDGKNAIICAINLH